ncbi:hypothetical protein PA598K_01361 [Paenibacillus sp. 598K]|uniref:hypothetical protein n=1 Tax=Paenibacillus sp. 598K TaxID=1117987 RepID=UPI000FF912F5|nr:hypothetical protein [Paenibacillus sp. 598K]GBF73076.1 hypothetical protein PA598K_01361 [Paenibacillus sp. 598K]
MYQVVTRDGDQITTLGHQPDLFDTFTVKGTTYVVNMINHGNQSCQAEEIVFGDYDTEETVYAICPHCGYRDADCFEWTPDVHTHNCGKCNHKFTYERHVEISYTTRRVGSFD